MSNKLILSKKIFIGLAIILSVALAGIYAWHDLFSQFAFYDDEGYLLITFDGYLKGLPLYDSIFTIYGPFFYLWHKGLYLLSGWDVGMDSIRWIVMSYWLLSAISMSALAYHLTRSWSWVLVCFSLSMIHLSRYGAEPGHPVSFVGVLMCVCPLLLLGYEKFPKLIGIVLGALAAGLLMVKLNVGIFMIAALGSWYINALPLSKLTALLKLGVRAVSLSLPVILMWSQLDKPFVATLCGTIVISLSCIYLSLPLSNTEKPGWKIPLFLLIGFVASLMLMAGLSGYQGTTWQGFKEQIIDLPFEFASKAPKGSGFEVYYATYLLCHLSLLLAIWCWWERVRGVSSEGLKGLLADIKLILGVLVLVATIPNFVQERQILRYVVPFLWVLILPAGKHERANSSGMILFVLFVAHQLMQNYPIYGSNAWITTVFLVPVACHWVHSALIQNEAPWTRSGRPWGWLLVFLILLCFEAHLLGVCVIVLYGILCALRQRRSWDTNDEVGKSMLCAVGVGLAFHKFDALFFAVNFIFFFLIFIFLRWKPGKAKALLPSLLVMASVSLLTHYAHAAWSRYAKHKLANFKSNRSVRLPEEQQLSLNWLSDNLSTYSKTNFSFPGLASLYLWAGQEPPTRDLITHWPSLLPEYRKFNILEKVRDKQELAFVYSPPIAGFWQLNLNDSQEVVLRYFVKDYRPWAKCGDYEYWRHSELKNRPPVNCAFWESDNEQKLLVVTLESEQVKHAKFATISSMNGHAKREAQEGSLRLVLDSGEISVVVQGISMIRSEPVKSNPLRKRRLKIVVRDEMDRELCRIPLVELLDLRPF